MHDRRVAAPYFDTQRGVDNELDVGRVDRAVAVGVPSHSALIVRVERVCAPVDLTVVSEARHR